MVIIPSEFPLVSYRVKHTIGIDVGRLCDRTALAAIETRKPIAAKPEWPESVEAAKEVPTKHYLRGLERFPENESFKKQVPKIVRILKAPNLYSPRIFMDRNGMGVGIFDDLKARKISSVNGVAITGAASPAREDEMGWCVGKSELINRPLILLQAEELVFEKKLRDIHILEHEFKEFRAKITQTGHTDYNAASGEHDDLVIAVALAVFGARLPEPTTDMQVRWAA